MIHDMSPLPRIMAERVGVGANVLMNFDLL